LRRLAVFCAVGLLAVGGGATGYVLLTLHRARDVRGSATQEFQQPTSTRAATPALEWTTYGFDASRTREAPGVALRPPYRRVWTWHGRALIEFPPAVAGGRLYVTTFDGRLYALDARTGRTVWRYRSRRCGWASPAVSGLLVVETFIGRVCSARIPGVDGEVIAFDARSGAIRWRRVIGPVESSPLIAGDSVYVGDWSGSIYSLSLATGRTRWTYRVGAQIKGSISLAEGRLYVGAYDGRLYALDAASGRPVWRADGQSGLFGRGTFYSTPAVAYGRVYIGSTDGKVYSYGARSGRLRWSHRTGGYVYASPAVWRGLVLVGSYDHSFYAFDAATGTVRWSFRANGPISGSASVLDAVVYFSTFDHRTYGLDAATGKPLWTWPDGEYSPVVSDGVRVYLTGLGRLYALVERR
jgi:outer membrane protein assembly factor BamB